MTSLVTGIPAAPPAAARRHFEARLTFETDCWDVHHAITTGRKDFVLIDVRPARAFAAGHLPTAVNIPVRELAVPALADIPMTTLCVVYCAGPHCNGATKAAVRLAGLGRPVKEMIGGVTGWLDEGFELVAESG